MRSWPRSSSRSTARCPPTRTSSATSSRCVGLASTFPLILLAPFEGRQVVPTSTNLSSPSTGTQVLRLGRLRHVQGRRLPPAVRRNRHPFTRRHPARLSLLPASSRRYQHPRRQHLSQQLVRWRFLQRQPHLSQQSRKRRRSRCLPRRVRQPQQGAHHADVAALSGLSSLKSSRLPSLEERGKEKGQVEEVRCVVPSIFRSVFVRLIPGFNGSFRLPPLFLRPILSSHSLVVLRPLFLSFLPSNLYTASFPPRLNSHPLSVVTLEGPHSFFCTQKRGKENGD
jgi:hypothetical protein